MVQAISVFHWAVISIVLYYITSYFINIIVYNTVLLLIIYCILFGGAAWFTSYSEFTAYYDIGYDS